MLTRTDWFARHRIVLGALVMALLAAAPAWADTINGGVTLPPDRVTSSGISVAPLTATRYVRQVQGIASVLDPQPLIALSARLAAARASAAAAAEQAAAAAAEATRSQQLYQHGENASLRDAQTAAATAAAAKAQQSAAVSAYAAERSSARAGWGSALAALAERGPQALADYADGRAALLAVAMPLGSAPSPPARIRVQLADGSSLSASLLGPSPRADAVLQGPTFFYRATGAQLRSGWRLTASVPLDTAAQNGVTVPAAAVLWYAGQAWVYVQTAADSFQRRPLVLNARDAAGWFQSSGFRVGDRVVVRGAELLLSQELLPPPGSKPPAGDGDDG
jgi:multidrug efflux system membrane fusion protein